MLTGNLPIKDGILKKIHRCALFFQAIEKKTDEFTLTVILSLEKVNQPLFEAKQIAICRST